MSRADAAYDRGGALRADALAPVALSLQSPLDAQPGRAHGRAVVATAGAVVVHAAFVLLALVFASAAVATLPRAAPRVTQLIDIELPKPAPPPEPEAAPAPEPVAPQQPPRVRARAAPAKSAAPPPAAAQAGQVLAAAEQVVDFGDTFVAGTGKSYAGGVTESGGTATHAVHDPRARAGGVEGGAGTDLRGDLSRAPQLAGGVRWDCPFPEEADDRSVDQAVVTLRVDVDREGGVANVEVTRDPGDGFGREARRCAQRKRWSPGRDRAGNSMAATTVVNVRFERQ